ncbi:histidine kinase dimerization/phospho-acceptor domain-containing protein [Chryseobacterium indoltheticum]|uniref:histidine kinase dimerization/phospho-acceptor domain-containing protein n=1 Tax=Chryseobacterium indoltheticum TaxID=254 RepID=UPI003F495474
MKPLATPLQHDLRNPLTTIQLSAQTFIYKKDMSDKMKLKLVENIIEGAKLINDMMYKIYKMSQVNNVDFTFDSIDPKPKIISIVENSKYQYEILTFSL